jgi:hypothetical protein
MSIYEFSNCKYSYRTECDQTHSYIKRHIIIVDVSNYTSRMVDEFLKISRFISTRDKSDDSDSDASDSDASNFSGDNYEKKYGTEQEQILTFYINPDENYTNRDNEGLPYDGVASSVKFKIIKKYSKYVPILISLDVMPTPQNTLFEFPDPDHPAVC